MRRLWMSLAVWTLCLGFLGGLGAEEWTKGMERGKAELKSAGPLAFGPGGVLFVADPLGARIWAIATGDTEKGDLSKGFEVKGLDAQIAAALGTEPAEIRIVDLAVHPVSGKAYLAVARGLGVDATPVILTVDRAGKWALLDLESCLHSAVELPDAPAADAVDRRSRPLRQECITDLVSLGDRLLVAGLSNEEFASSLRSIPFPFGDVSRSSSVEIFHGAHGRFETHSPVRTFVAHDIGGAPHLVAAYQCTPLVTMPLSEIKPGNKVKGKTIAELGNRNRPLDMIVYQKDGKDWLLIANSSRGIMKVSVEPFADADEIEDRVGGGGTAGVPYETIAEWTGVEQIDIDGGDRVAVLTVDDSGVRALESRKLP